MERKDYMRKLRNDIGKIIINGGSSDSEEVQLLAQQHRILGQLGKSSMDELILNAELLTNEALLRSLRKKSL